MGARRYCYEDGFAKAFLLFSDEIEKKRATERKRRQATAAYDPAFHQPFLYPRASPPKQNARPRRTTRKRNKGSVCMSPASPRFIALACVAPARPRPPAVAAATGGGTRPAAVLTTRKSAAPRRRRTEGAEEGGGRGEEEKREREEGEERGGGGGGKEKGCSIENFVSFLF